MNPSEFPQAYFGAKAVDKPLDPKQLLPTLASYKRRCLIPFIMRVPEGGRVLDAGCGKGKTIRLIQTFRPDVTVVGSDITDVSTFLPRRVEFVQCATDDIGSRFAPESFDAIICQHVIEHLLHPTGTMHSFKRVLKKRGALFVETPNWVRLIMPFSQKFFWNDYTHVRPFSKQSFRRMFVEYGFTQQLVVSVSSTDFIERRSAPSRLLPTQQAPLPASQRPFFQRAVGYIIHRAIDPFFKDVLIGIASK